MIEYMKFWAAQTLTELLIAVVVVAAYLGTLYLLSRPRKRR